jgi:hypothetical protein
MPSIDSQQIFNISQAEGGKFAKLDTSDIPSLSSMPQGSYAILTYDVNGGGGGGGSDPNNAYQDVPFSNQVSVLSSAESQITTNAKKGWLTLSVDPDTTDIVYVGPVGVTTGDGYKLTPKIPSITVSSDNLSEWYVIGTSGGENLYVCGAYIT